MAWFDGIFRCSPLGVDDCVVWWDAIAAVGGWAAVAVALIAIAVAWGGVVITGASAVFVWRLGVEANRASNLAVSIAMSEADRQTKRDERERILVLLQLNGEVSRNQKRADDLRKKFADPAESHKFVVDYIFRTEVIRDLAAIVFPTVGRLVDRLHYLDKTEGPALARSVGIIESVNKEYEDGVTPPTEQNLILNRGAICLVLDTLIIDLGIIRAACQAEIIASGIDNELIRKHGGAAASREASS